MQCLVCGLRSGYNRAVVTTDGIREIGLLCRRCEGKAFGNALRDSLQIHPKGCTLCKRDAIVYLLEWNPLVEEGTDGGLILKNESEITPDTPMLCGDHYGQLRIQPQRVDDSIAP